MTSTLQFTRQIVRFATMINQRLARHFGGVHFFIKGRMNHPKPNLTIERLKKARQHINNLIELLGVDGDVDMYDNVCKERQALRDLLLVRGVLLKRGKQ